MNNNETNAAPAESIEDAFAQLGEILNAMNREDIPLEEAFAHEAFGVLQQFHRQGRKEGEDPERGGTRR